MPKGQTPSRKKLDDDAQDLLMALGIQPLAIEEIQERYDRSKSNVHRRLVPRARMFARANGIVLDRPIHADGYLYRARWEWTDDQKPSWATTLRDLLSRTSGIKADMATYAANAKAEGQEALAEQLEDIHDLFKVTTKSIAKASLLVQE
jgi:hypothetical protein